MSYPASMAPGDTAEGKLKFLFNPNMPAYCRDGEPDEPNTSSVIANYRGDYESHNVK